MIYLDTLLYHNNLEYNRDIAIHIMDNMYNYNKVAYNITLRAMHALSTEG